MAKYSADVHDNQLVTMVNGENSPKNSLEKCKKRKSKDQSEPVNHKSKKEKKELGAPLRKEDETEFDVSGKESVMEATGILSEDLSLSKKKHKKHKKKQRQECDVTPNMSTSLSAEELCLDKKSDSRKDKKSERKRKLIEITENDNELGAQIKNEMSSQQCVAHGIKKKKMKFSNGDGKSKADSSLNCSDDHQERSKHKKRKKKSKDLEHLSLENKQIDGNESSALENDVVNRKHKSSSTKKAVNGTDASEVSCASQDIHENDAAKSKGKKKSKLKDTDSALRKSDDSMFETDSGNAECKKHKKKKYKEVEVVVSDNITVLESNTHVKKHKKKKKSKDTESEVLSHTTESHDAVDHFIPSQEVVGHKKKKKKNKDCKDSENITDAGALGLDIAKPQDVHTDKIHKKKDKTKSKDKADSMIQGSGADVSSSKVVPGTEASEMASLEQNIDKRQKKKKKEKKDNKNCDETSSNTTQQNAQSGSATSKSDDVIVGQWQGNLFESTERQNKFLRLLGGMKKSSDESGETKRKGLFAPQPSGPKKGLFGSLATLANKDQSTKGSSAMTVSAAANLDQKLEEEYNRAMNFKLTVKKGTGFGFTPDPAEGKKFHIDINKSKSVKFDD